MRKMMNKVLFGALVMGIPAGILASLWSVIVGVWSIFGG